MRTHTVPLRRARSWLAAGAAIAALAALAGGVLAAPAQAFPRTPWHIVDSASLNGAQGNFIWQNRSVRVAARLEHVSPTFCMAVVFTAYDRSNHQVARVARPGDGVHHYLCGFAARSYGFTLNASHVFGGIRKIVVDLWQRRGARVSHTDRVICGRPRATRRCA